MFMRVVSDDLTFERCLEIDNPAELYDYAEDYCSGMVVKGQHYTKYFPLRVTFKEKLLSKLEGQSVYIWGMSGGGQNIKDTLLDSVVINAAFDNDPNKQNTETDYGFTIFAPEQLKTMPKLPVLIVSAYSYEIQEQIRQIDPSIISLAVF